MQRILYDRAMLRSIARGKYTTVYCVVSKTLMHTPRLHSRAVAVYRFFYKYRLDGRLQGRLFGEQPAARLPYYVLNISKHIPRINLKPRDATLQQINRQSRIKSYAVDTVLQTVNFKYFQFIISLL